MERYSLLMQITGSIRAARSAGRKVEMPPIRIIRIVTVPSVSGSVGDTS